MLITTWGNEKVANAGKLHDYANRCWAGLLGTYYLPRWQRFFKSLSNQEAQISEMQWYDMERAWQQNQTLSFGTRTNGHPVQAARRTFSKYFGGI